MGSWGETEAMFLLLSWEALVPLELSTSVLGQTQGGSLPIPRPMCSAL